MTVHCGPMRCQGCGWLVRYGVNVVHLADRWHSPIRHRGMFNVVGDRVHLCPARKTA